MQDKPLVSVITNFLNCEQFIREAIESVLEQTYSEWELLLVDDGSTDGSTGIALEYAEKFPRRVRYIEHADHTNRGTSASRNLGIEQSAGEYVAFLDADDVWFHDKLERQVAIMNRYPAAGVLYGSALWWHSWTGRPEDALRDRRDYVEERGVRPNTLIEPPVLVSIFLRHGDAVPCPTTVIARRDVLKRIGGFEESFPGMYDDQVFYAKVALDSPVFASGECWAKYRRHPGSMCHIAYEAGEEQAARLAFLDWLEKILTEHGVKDAEVWKALRAALRPYRYPARHRIEEGARRGGGKVKTLAKAAARRMLPMPVRRWLKMQLEGDSYQPPVGWLRLGDTRRVTPISRTFGFDRGLPIDRYYIEKFFARRAGDIQGRILEIGENTYTRRFGGERVIQSDVLHVSEGNPQATIVADITRADDIIPSDTFDCVIFAQTLHLIYDMRAAVKTIHRILKPGGVALVTVPGISQIDYDEWREYWCWSLTTYSARRLFGEAFPEQNVEIENHGNVLAATAFLQGLAAQELREDELDHTDPAYQVVIMVRATKLEVA